MFGGNVMGSSIILNKSQLYTLRNHWGMNTENNKQKKKRKLHEFIDIKKEEILEEISKAL